MKTTDYMHNAMKAANAKNKAELAAKIGVNRSAITMYESGERIMDDYTASRVADLLGIDPMALIAQANAEREKDESKRKYWQQKAAAFFEHATGARKLAQTFYNI